MEIPKEIVLTNKIGQPRKCSFDWVHSQDDGEKLAIVTAPGFDEAVEASNSSYLQPVLVGSYCNGCHLQTVCYASVKVDGLAGTVNVTGYCRK